MQILSFYKLFLGSWAFFDHFDPHFTPGVSNFGSRWCPIHTAFFLVAFDNITDLLPKFQLVTNFYEVVVFNAWTKHKMTAS